MGFVYRLHHPKDPNQPNLRIQIYNTWIACSNAKEFLEFIAPSIEEPHARLYLLQECFKVYLEEQKKIDDQREAERKREQELEEQRKMLQKIQPPIIKGAA